jgi:hypothetical protein
MFYALCARFMGQILAAGIGCLAVHLYPARTLIRHKD